MLMDNVEWNWAQKEVVGVAITVVIIIENCFNKRSSAHNSVTHMNTHYTLHTRTHGYTHTHARTRIHTHGYTHAHTHTHTVCLCSVVVAVVRCLG